MDNLHPVSASPIQPGDIVHFTPEFIAWRYPKKYRSYGETWSGRVATVKWDNLNNDYVASVQDLVGDNEVARIGVDKLVKVGHISGAEIKAFANKRHAATAAFDKEFGLESQGRLDKPITGEAMETTKRLAMLRERTAKLGQKKSKVEVLTMVCPKCKGGGIFEGKVCPRCKGQRTVLSSNLSDLRERLAKLKGRPRVEVVTMICPECKGSGLKEGGLCPKCKGKMTVLEVKKITELTNICPECKGGGFVGGKVCPKCKGTRAYSEPEHRVWGEELKKLRTRIRARKA